MSFTQTKFLKTCVLKNSEQLWFHFKGAVP